MNDLSFSWSKETFWAHVNDICYFFQEYFPLLAHFSKFFVPTKSGRCEMRKCWNWLPMSCGQDAEARVEFEKELRQQLSRQAAAHSDHLRDVLQVQATELDRQCEREVHTQLLQERQSFQTEVAGWIARLKGIETAVEGQFS